MSAPVRHDLTHTGFSCSFERDGSGATLVLGGEIDAVSAAELWPLIHELIAPDEVVDVRVDLRDVSFLDASGIRLLLDTERTVSDHAGRVVLAEPSPVVTRLLDLVGLCDRFPLVRRGSRPSGGDVPTRRS